MIIEILVCKADGTQTLEQREVTDDYAAGTSEATQTPTPDEDRDAMAVDHEYRLTTLELGVNDNAVQNA